MTTNAADKKINSNDLGNKKALNKTALQKEAEAKNKLQLAYNKKQAGVNLTDITFGYRLAPTELLQNINWEEVKHPFFLETALKPIRLGVTIHEIPVLWESRVEGESQNSFWATFKYLKIAFKVRIESKSAMLKKRI